MTVVGNQPLRSKPSCLPVIISPLVLLVLFSILLTTTANVDGSTSIDDPLLTTISNNHLSSTLNQSEQIPLLKELISDHGSCLFLHEWSDQTKCEWAIRCSTGASHVPYNEIAFCWIKSSWLNTFVLLLWIAFLFWITGNISDRFLSAPMIHLATLLNLSEALAGCTIVACSNSAADILSGIIAAYSDPKQLGIFMGDAIGGALFLILLVFGSVLLFSPYNILPLSKRMQFRDTAFLLINFVLLFILMHLPRWAWWAPLFHITVFIAYVIIAIYFDPREHPSDTEQVSLLPVGDQPQHLYSEKSNIPSTPSTPSSRQLTPRPSYSSLTDAMRNEQKSRSSSPRHLSIPKRCSLLLESRAGRRLLSKILYESSTDQERYLEMLANSPAESLNTLIGDVKAEKVPSSPFIKFLSVLSNIVLFPIVFLWKLTIPTIDSKPRARWRSALFFLTIPLAICGNSWRSIRLSTAVAVVVMGSVAAFAYFIFYSRDQKSPSESVEAIRRPRSGLVRTCFAGFMALFWTSIVAAEVVQCIATLGLVLRLSNELLGLTIMAWGNNMGDLFANVAISRAGHTRMGLAGTYGACIVTISFGIPIVATVHILRQVFNQVPPSIVPFTFDKSLMVAGTASVFVTIGWFVHAAVKRFRVSRGSGLYLIIGFIIVNILIALCVILYPHS